nr:hypothetical protein [uncultured Allomuricauda sp.]
MSCSSSNDQFEKVNVEFADLQGNWRTIKYFASRDINGKIDIDERTPSGICYSTHIIRYDFDDNGDFIHYVGNEDESCIDPDNIVSDYDESLKMLRVFKIELGDGYFLQKSLGLDVTSKQTLLELNSTRMRTRSVKVENPSTPLEYNNYHFTEFHRID